MRSALISCFFAVRSTLYGGYELNNSEFFRGWRDRLTETKDIAPLKFGMTQEEAIAILGEPDAVSTMKSRGKPLILKYQDIELHFDRSALFLVFSDGETELAVKAVPAQNDRGLPYLPPSSPCPGNDSVSSHAGT